MCSVGALLEAPRVRARQLREQVQQKIAVPEPERVPVAEAEQQVAERMSGEEFRAAIV